MRFVSDSSTDGVAPVLLGGAVAAGASLGAIGRLSVSALIPSTFILLIVINVAGSALLGAFTALWSDRPVLLSFAGTGFCGGFTTFSTFIVFFLGQSQMSMNTAGSVVAIHLLLCPLAYWLAQESIQRIRRKANN